MEAIGLFLGSAQAVAQLAGVVKRHVVSYSMMYSRASSIEAKAVNASRAANKLGLLTEVPGLTNNLLLQKLMELKGVERKLSSVSSRLSRSSSVVALLRAPILLRELNDIDSDLTQLDSFFHMIGIISSLLQAHRTESRELALMIAESCRSGSGNTEQHQQVIFELESRCRQLDSALALSSRVVQAEKYFAMGLVDFQQCKGGSVRHRIAPNYAPEKMQAAARYFRKACNLGKKEAFRYLGDIFYLGYGVKCCLRTAVEVYEQGVARGDTASSFGLGLCYQLGHGVEIQMKAAIQLYSKAADQGCPESMWALGQQKMNGKYIAPNYGEASQLLQKAVRMGVTAARGDLALCYDRGIGVEQDSSKSFQLLREAFDAGSMVCIADLAHCYNTGRGVAKNPEESVKLYEQCIQAGTWHGDYYKALYGLHLVQGLGVRKNEARGKAIIIDATNTGNAIAWYALGECYRNGYGWKENKEQARYFYQRAISCKNGLAGLVGSYEALGEMFEVGEGGIACAERSSTYYLRAANMLSARGQWKAAIAFERGAGQIEDLNRAVHLFKMCANSGDPNAQRKTLGYYMKGHGLERSRVHARKMIRDAAKDGNLKAKGWLLREDMRNTLGHFRRSTA